MSRKTKFVSGTLVALSVFVMGAVAWENVRESVIDWYDGEPIVYQSTSTVAVDLPELEQRIEFWKGTREADEVVTLWATKKAVAEQRDEVERMEEELRARELEMSSLQ